MDAIVREIKWVKNPRGEGMASYIDGGVVIFPSRLGPDYDCPDPRGTYRTCSPCIGETETAVLIRRNSGDNYYYFAYPLKESAEVAVAVPVEMARVTYRIDDAELSLPAGRHISASVVRGVLTITIV